MDEASQNIQNLDGGSAVRKGRQAASEAHIPQQANITNNLNGGAGKARKRYQDKQVSFNKLDSKLDQRQKMSPPQFNQSSEQQLDRPPSRDIRQAKIATKLTKHPVFQTDFEAANADNTSPPRHIQSQYIPAPIPRAQATETKVKRLNVAGSTIAMVKGEMRSPFSNKGLYNAANKVAPKQPTIHMDTITPTRTVSISDDDQSKPLWKHLYDSNQIYQLEEKFKLSTCRREHLLEMKRWRDADQKGNRETYYVKEVQKKNADIMTIIDQTRLEKAHSHTDGHKCLNFRKKIMKFRIHVSDAANRVTSSKYFEGLIIVVIGLNCITLAQSDSTKEETPVAKSIDLTFNIIYTVEMFLRIFSLGFLFGKGAYLKSMWCQLDFICVTTAYLEMLGGSGTSIGGLRAFRVLRPLRFVNNIQGLKSIIQSVMKAIPVLKNTIAVLFFFFLIFAIGGLNLFMGQLKQRCIEELTGDIMLDDQGDQMLCGSSDCPVGYFCGKTTLNPNYDVTNFDNIFWALLNVFQCITLEGWSEIMVMYQKAYSPLTIFFFVPMVFIGAFFLLNLTLAVIQSTYSQTQSEQKAEKERLRKEQDQLASSAQKSSGQNDGDDNQDEDGAKKNSNIGVAAFFVAKRAANKMKKFWINHQRVQTKLKEKADQILVDETKKYKEDEKQGMLRRSFALKKQASRRISSNSVSPDKKNKSSVQSKNSGTDPQGELLKHLTGQRENTAELEDQFLREYSEEDIQNNRTITEEDGLSDDNQSEDVRNFLKQVASVTDHVTDPKPSFDNIPPPRGQTPIGSKTLRVQSRMINPIMAFNDVRIAAPARSRKINKSFDQNARPKNIPRTNNFTKISMPVSGRQAGAADININDLEDLNADWFLDELDFDKVVNINNSNENERLNKADLGKVRRDETQLAGGNATGELWDVELPADITLSDRDYRAVADNISLDDQPARPRILNQLNDEGDDDMKSSIISSSDNSVNDYTKMDYEDNPFDRSGRDNTRLSRKELIESKLQTSKDIKGKLKRTLTTEFVKKQMNNSQSTLLCRQPSIKQQIDCLSNLQIDGQMSSAKKNRKSMFSSIAHTEKDKTRTGGFTGTMNSVADPRATYQSKVSEQVVQGRKEKLSIYQDIGEYFSNSKPTNPLNFIDNNTQKVVINPGVPYVSTSQNEIFERREFLFQKEYLNKLNPFIAAPKDDVEQGIYEGDEEETYIKTQFEAYQMKTLYKVKQVDEMELDSDDEDALILAQQPFETVMQTGFKDYLNHCNTKFIARRSDIIVSATMSITLTPGDDKFVPAQFKSITSEGIWDYVMKRQEYRAFSVSSNIPPTLKQSNNVIYSESSFSNSQVQIPDSQVDLSVFDDDQNLDFVVERPVENSGQQMIQLPSTLQSVPLDPKLVPRLSKKEKRMYTIQKGKYDQTNKTNTKKAQHPRETQFDLIEARELFKGTYHKDEDEDEMQEIKMIHEDDGKVKLNRAMVNMKVAPQHELDVDDFEAKLIDYSIENIDIQNGQDPRKNIDYVPAHIKKEFDLRQDMTSYEIDFDLVRSNDAQFKKRQPIWSGQEVLDEGLNMNKSAMILKKINLLRVWPKGFYNIVKKVRCIMKQFIRLSVFENFLTGCVLINTIVMAMDSYDIDAQTEADLIFMNDIFTWIFIVEMTIKLLARGPKKYANEPMNLLDGGVVTLSIVEVVLTASGGASGAGSLQAFRTVRVFRTFRVLRVTRVLRALKSMAQVIGVIQRTFMDFILITILMFVFIFIYTLLGRQIFQGQYDFGPGEELPRANFETFTVAFITVFQVLTMENWQQVLYSSMRAANNSMIIKTIAAIYYISWIFIGNFILLNLFLAILIDGFTEEDADADDVSDEGIKAQAAAVLQKQKLQKESKDKRMKRLGTSVAQLKSMQLNQGNSELEKKRVKKDKARANFTGVKMLREEDLDDIEDMNTNQIRKMLVTHGILKARKEDNIDNKLVGPEIKADNSLYLFNRKGKFRRYIHFIQKHRYFESFIMLLIALSSVKLAMESYFVNEPEDSPIKKTSSDLDYVFNNLFNVECVLKVLALGFAMDEGSYLRDAWNKLDFFIVVTANIDMMLANTDIPALKVLRMLRMIRPLRVISHNPQLKMIVAALAESVGAIVNVSFIVLIIWLMFAIYGMNTYMGMFFYCSEEPYVYNTQWVCEDHGGKWLRFDSNFDDIGQSMMTLFIIASLEGWPDIMYQAIDITKTDNGPKQNASTANSAFFIIFILIGSFFFLNFFIGVLFLKYEEAQKREEAGFTKGQLYWAELQRLIIKAKTPHELRYKPLTRGFRYLMWQVVNSSSFEISIMACIVLNMFQMALDHEGASPSIIEFLKVSNYVFTVIFLLEAILKLLVYRMAYFKTGWNKFDFFVVMSSLIDLAIEMMLPTPEGGQEDGGSAILSVGPQLARVLRVLRVSRVLRLAGKNDDLQALLKTIMMSIDSLFNVFILLMLIFFIMAVLGNTMFFDVFEGNVIDEYKNFTNFHMSFSLLFSISTGEDWNRIMYDTMNTGPDCIPGKTCGSTIAPVFFIIFIMLVTNIMLNLFILVIIQQFQKYYLDKGNPLECFEEDFKDFQEAWAKFTDQYSCTKMKPKNIPDFFKKLPNRMQMRIGVSESAPDEEINRVILKMGINVEEGFIYFHEMLYRIMRAQFVLRIGLKLNKVMTVQELVTQYRISEITLKNKETKSVSKDVIEEFYFQQNQAMPVNLFLTKMFYKTSFKAWRNITKKHALFDKWKRNQEEEKERSEIMGRSYTEPTYVEEPIKMEEVEIEREEFSEWSHDSDEDDIEIDTKSKKSLGTHAFQSQFTKSNHQHASPEWFRHRAKMRMSSNQKKFALILDESLLPNENRKSVSPEKKVEKSMLIVHTEEEAKATANLNYVDPNSQAYQNAVLEDKINKHQKVKKGNEVEMQNLMASTQMRKSVYAGQFSSVDLDSGPNSNFNSPSRINGPLKSSRFNSPNK